MNDDQSNKERYLAAAHGMQTGVKLEMGVNPDGAGTSPKHLRVGINSAMADHSGLVALLIRKGIITESEYLEAIADSMERERDRYQSLLPGNIKLG